MTLARRELVGAAFLMLAPVLFWGLRPALWTFAPTLSLDASLASTRADPWGRGLMGPPIGLHDTDQPVYYSRGWNGVDDTRMHEGTDALLRLDYGNIVQLSNTALIDGVLGSTPKERYVFDLSAPPTPRDPVWEAYDERIYRGVLGDDVLPTWERSWRTDLVARPLERWLALLALGLGWLVAFHPRAPRDARFAVEGLRVAALASLPGVLLAWFALTWGGVELALRLPLVTYPEVAVGGSVALATLLLAAWIRAAQTVPPVRDGP